MGPKSPPYPLARGTEDTIVLVRRRPSAGRPEDGDAADAMGRSPEDRDGLGDEGRTMMARVGAGMAGGSGRSRRSSDPWEEEKEDR